MKPSRTLLLTLCLFLSGANFVARAQEWHVEKAFHVGGEGRWDYLTVYADNHRLFVPRTTHTMVIDAATGETLGDIPGQKNAHGVAIVPEAGRGFLSDGGGEGAVVIFDLKSYSILGTIPAQPDADGIIFDKSDGRVLVVSGDGGTLMSLKPDIDPKTGKLESPIELGGKPEFLASDGAGKVYINLEDKDQVAVVDMKARKVLARWPVAPGGAPVGMSIDPSKGRLFIGCRKPQELIVMSTTDGKVLADLPIGSGVDATKFDGRQIFASCSDGILAVAAETSAGRFEIVQNVTTPRGARTMGVDAADHAIYLPTAEFEDAKSGPATRPTVRPNTFMIAVVRR